jgi:hypothetical protein
MSSKILKLRLLCITFTRKSFFRILHQKFYGLYLIEYIIITKYFKVLCNFSSTMYCIVLLFIYIFVLYSYILYIVVNILMLYFFYSSKYYKVL